jgi:uncharacterized GH25 family protein
MQKRQNFNHHKQANKMKKSFITIITFLMPFLATAHGDWIEVKGNGKIGEPAKVELIFGAYENQERLKGKALNFLAEFTVFVIDPAGNRQDIKLTQTETCWEGSFIPKTEGTYQVMGINEERGVVDWTVHGFDVLRPKEYLRTNYVVGKASEIGQNMQFLDVISTKTGEEVKLTAYLNGVKIAKTKLLITNPEGWEKIKYTNANGEATFKPTVKGMYMIEVENLDKTPGSFKGKDYKMIRNKGAVMVEVNN